MRHDTSNATSNEQRNEQRATQRATSNEQHNSHRATSNTTAIEQHNEPLTHQQPSPLSFSTSTLALATNMSHPSDVHNVSSLWDDALPYAVAALALYLSLRQLFNVDRALLKLWPSFVVLFGYYRYRVALAAPSPWSSSSLLLAYWTAAQRRAPVVEAVVGDSLLGIGLVAAVAAAVDLGRRARYVSRKHVLNVVGGFVLSAMKQLPFVKTRVALEMKKFEQDVERLVRKNDRLANKMAKLYALPDKGMDDAQLLALMAELAGTDDDKWRDGLVSGAVYHGEKAHLDVLNQAYALFGVSNPLHADLWPAVTKFEAEVIAMTAGLMNGGHADVCGSLSSGGTESIFLATKTHREFYRHKHGITKPEIIACVTAHAAIDKACDILGIRLIKVPMDPKTLKIDVHAVRWSISANTILLYSSAPNFPHGIIDDIEALSKLAVRHDVGLHVDCCLGGFVLPFARQLRQDIPAFDFSLPGVTSMSCDTHKYGYGSKGTSVVLYKNADIRRFQYFAYPDWTGGLYATPTLAGSRSGALSATAWAAMVRLGHEGYLEKTKGILDTVDAIKAGIQRIDGIHVLGDPKAMVVSFAGDTGVSALKVSDAMAKHGWSLNPLQHPTSVHLCVTVRQIGKAQKFLDALEDAVNEVKKDPNPSPEGGSAIYGMASSLPAGPVDDLLRIYTDITLKV